MAQHASYHTRYRFQVVDALITNVHLPALNPAPAGQRLASKDLIERAYQEAIRERYRFLALATPCLFNRINSSGSKFQRSSVSVRPGEPWAAIGL